MTLDVADAAREAGRHPAWVLGEAVVSFAELARRAALRVPPLRALGAPAEPVALVGDTRPETLETIYAALQLGKPLALLHPRWTPAEAKAVLRECALGRFEPVAESRPASSPDGAVSGVPPHAPLSIVFTSGTTGRPKGVVLSRRAFLASARASALNLGWHAADRWLLGLPIAHVGGLSILIRCLLARRTVVIPREVAEGRRLTPHALQRCIEDDRVTLLSLVPTQLHHVLLACPTWRPPSHLRAVLLGGAHAPAPLLQRAADRGWPVLTTYGLTEACSQVATQPLGTVNRGNLGSGRLVEGTEARLVGDVLHLRGPTLLSGYYPTCARDAPLDADGWFCTGDHARIDPEGFLHVLGRRTDRIVTGGENVHPAEVERVIEEMDGVDAACAFGVTHDAWGQTVAVALVAASPPSDAALVRFLSGRLAPYKRPRQVAVLDHFVLTPAGKLDREATARAAIPRLRALPG